MTTDITVRGQARDIREPDRAILSLVAKAEGPDGAKVHERVADAMASLSASVDALKAAHPGALERISVSQAYQSNYPVKGVKRFTETVRVTARFTDFHVMSEWAFGCSNEVVAIWGVQWVLSPEVLDEVRDQLGRAAVLDARVRATTFAEAAGMSIIGVKALADPGLLPGARGDDDFGERFALGAGGGPRGGDSTIDLTPEPIETIANVEAHFLAE